MTDSDSTALLERAAPAIDALVDTLHAEASALGELDTLLRRQLDALRDGQPETLEETAAQVHDCSATLETLKEKRARQTRLLGRVLGTDADSLRELVASLRQRAGAGARLADARAAVRDRAQETQQRGETLRFALEYAAGLNRDLLLAMQGATGDGAGGQTYTATGHAQPSAGVARPFLNAVG